MTSETKRCKFCGEQILSEAIKCKHCKSELISNNKINSGAYKKKTKGINLIISGILTVIIIVLLFYFIVFGKQNIITFDQIQKRNGLLYKVNEKKPFTGKVVRYHKNKKNQKSDETELIDGKFHGKMTVWYKNGQKKMESNFRNGQPIGEPIFWDEQGNINTIEVLDKQKLTYTLGDMKSIATGVEMYRTQVQFLPDIYGTVAEAYASVPVLAEITGHQRVTKDGWGNDFIITSSRNGDSYAIASPGKDGIFKGWNQSGPLLTETDFNDDVIYSDGMYVKDPAEQISKSLYKNIVEGTLRGEGEYLGLEKKGETLYCIEFDWSKASKELREKMDFFNLMSVSIKGVVIDYKNKPTCGTREIDSYIDANNKNFEIEKSEPLSSKRGKIEGFLFNNFITTNTGVYYLKAEPKNPLKKCLDFVNSQIISFPSKYEREFDGIKCTVEGLIEKHKNGNQFIILNSWEGNENLKKIIKDKPFNGEYITYYYKNGQKKSRKFYKDCMLQGESFEWFEDGQVKYEITYKNGKRESFFSWFNNGNKHQECYYINGKRNGKLITWYDNSKKASEINYLNGKEDGEFIWWKKNGDIRNKMIFKNGKEVTH